MTRRREFLKILGTAGTGLVLGLRLAAKPSRAADPKEAFRPNATLAVRPDGTVKITVGKVEMGQGVRTALPMVVAEEMDLDWSRVDILTAQPGPDFMGMSTGGSTSVSSTWLPLRRAGAAARDMLKQAAASQWRVPLEQCRTEQGFVLGPGGKKAGFGSLAEAASKLPVPAKVTLKAPGDFRLLGQRLPRVDGLDIVTGRAVYGLDVRRPGQRYATVLRCAVSGGQLRSWDQAKALAVAGVQAVVKVPTGLAVIADSTWAALKGREALAGSASWDEGMARDFDSQSLESSMRQALAGPADPARTVGDVDQAFKVAARSLEADYAFPSQAHATLEPMNATASVGRADAELWCGSQSPNRVQERAAAALGLEPDQVQVTLPLLGGGFGRRLGTDFSTEAAQVARAAGGGPIQVIWDRTDDFTQDLYHPPTLHHLRAGLGATGQLTAWSHRIAGPAVLRSWSGGKKNPAQASVEANGALDIPYDIPAIRVDFAEVPAPMTLGWWRGIQIVPNVFARECFLDEIAHALGTDPLQLRLRLLGQQGKVKFGRDEADLRRLKRVLEVAAEKAGWGRTMPRGHGMGLACHAYDGRTYGAAVAEASVAEGRLRVHRITCALDCGFAVNPSGLEAQVEGGLAFGLSALWTRITWEKGRAVQTGFQDFPLLRLPDMPEVRVHIISSSEAPSGAGEPPVPLAIPSVLNAVFAATL